MSAVNIDREILYSLISDISGVRKELSDSTRIYHDLFISGDDADELLEKIHAKFGTEFEELDFSAYFPEETDSFIWHFAMRLGVKCKKKEMTIGHLLDVIRKKAWFDP